MWANPIRFLFVPFRLIHVQHTMQLVVFIAWRVNSTEARNGRALFMFMHEFL